jgi:hypothetical protein
MSMKFVLTQFREDGGKLLADYSSIGEEVSVTEFLDGVIALEFFTDFNAFEEDEEVTYKEIEPKSIDVLSSQLDEKSNDLLNEIRKTSGAGRRNELVDNLQDIICLSRLCKEFYKINSSTNTDAKTKLIIS